MHSERALPGTPSMHVNAGYFMTAVGLNLSFPGELRRAGMQQNAAFTTAQTAPRRPRRCRRILSNFLVALKIPPNGKGSIPNLAGVDRLILDHIGLAAISGYVRSVDAIFGTPSCGSRRMYKLHCDFPGF
jgi:hypothetical protein